GIGYCPAYLGGITGRHHAIDHHAKAIITQRRKTIGLLDKLALWGKFWKSHAIGYGRSAHDLSGINGGTGAFRDILARSEHAHIFRRIAISFIEYTGWHLHAFLTRRHCTVCEVSALVTIHNERIAIIIPPGGDRV